MSTKISVLPDPKLPVNKTQMEAKAKLLDRLQADISKVTAEVDRLRSSQKTLKQVSKKLSDEDKDLHKELIEEAKELETSIKDILKTINPPTDIQGFSRDPAILQYAFQGTQRLLQSTLFPSTSAQEAIATALPVPCSNPTLHPSGCAPVRRSCTRRAAPSSMRTACSCSQVPTRWCADVCWRAQCVHLPSPSASWVQPLQTALSL